jgi:hypothetical protein
VQVLIVLGPPTAASGDPVGLSAGAAEARSLLVVVVSPEQEAQLASATAFAALSIAIV